MRRRGTALAAALAVTVAAGAALATPRETTEPVRPEASDTAPHAAGPPAAGAAVGSRRPNVVLITADDASIGDLRTMPHVRRLVAARGTRFDNAVAPTPICVPSRASLLTGQLAHNHGARTIHGRSGGFDAFDDRDTLPTWLRREGYRTMFVGKYLNGYGKASERPRTYVPPGWSDWVGTLDPSTYRYRRTKVSNDGHQERLRGYSTDALTRVATDLIGSAARDRRRDGTPFYLWLNYVAPHSGGPVEPDDPLARHPRHPDRRGTPAVATRHRDDFRGTPLPRTPNLFEKDVSDKANPATRRPGGWSRVDRAIVREVHQQRLEALQAVDEGVARVVRRLRASGQLRRTVVVYVSDNGFATGEHNIVGKIHPYVESAGVPLVLAGPGVPRGQRTSVLAAVPDLAVTIAALAGAEPGREVDGVDLLDLVDAPGRRERVVPVAQWKDRSGRLLYSGVKTARWTYVRYTAGGEELFDRRADPYELRSLASAPRARDVLTRMRLLHVALRACEGAECAGARDVLH